MKQGMPGRPAHEVIKAIAERWKQERASGAAASAGTQDTSAAMDCSVQCDDDGAVPLFTLG